MPIKSRALTRRPLWIITRYENNQMDALTIAPDLHQSFLALFSYEEEAEAFVCLLGDDEKKKGWRSEQTTAAELVSVLLGPCAAVKGVALDPLPLALSREMLPLVSMSRALFLQYLLEERRGQQESLRSENARGWVTSIHRDAENGYSRKPGFWFTQFSGTHRV